MAVGVGFEKVSSSNRFGLNDVCVSYMRWRYHLNFVYFLAIVIITKQEKNSRWILLIF